jgi:hypothetical protein
MGILWSENILSGTKNAHTLLKYYAKYKQLNT